MAGVVRIARPTIDEDVHLVGAGWTGRARARHHFLGGGLVESRQHFDHVFNFEFLKIDSDQAYQVAEKNGGSKLTQKDPKQPVYFILDWNAPKNELLWHVIYGQSMDGAKLKIAVNASTGLFEKVEE